MRRVDHPRGLWPPGPAQGGKKRPTRAVAVHDLRMGVAHHVSHRHDPTQVEPRPHQVERHRGDPALRQFIAQGPIGPDCRATRKPQSFQARQETQQMLGTAAACPGGHHMEYLRQSTTSLAAFYLTPPAL